MFGYSAPRPLRYPYGATPQIIVEPEYASTGYEPCGWDQASETLYARLSTNLYKSTDQGQTFQSVKNFTPDYPGNVLHLASGTLLCSVTVIGGNYCIFRSVDNGATWNNVLDFGSASIGFMRLGWCETTQTPVRIFIAEYTTASGATVPQTKLWMSDDDGLTWTAVQTWVRGTGAGEIRHLHAAQWDEYGQKVWIASGDSDSQSYLWTTEDGSVLTEIGTGSQSTWRTTALGFDRWYTYWVSDADANPLYMYRLLRGGTTPEQYLEMPSISYFVNKDLDGGLWFYTLAAQNNTSSYKYPGNTVEIFTSADHREWQKVAEFPRKTGVDAEDASIGPGYFTTDGKMICRASNVVALGTTIGVRGLIRFNIRQARRLAQ